MAHVFSPTKLRTLRQERGYTRMQLAFAVRRNVDQVGAWERGRDVPNYDSIQRLLRILDCGIEDLFEDSAEETSGGARAGSSRLLAGAAPASTTGEAKR